MKFHSLRSRPVFFGILLVFSLFSHADETVLEKKKRSQMIPSAQSESVPQAPGAFRGRPRRGPKKGEWGVSLFGFFRSQITIRGALVWPDFAAMVLPAFAYSDWLRLRGPGFEVYQRWGWFELGTGPFFFQDEPLINWTGREKTFRNSRKSRFEWALRLKADLPLRFRAGMNLFQGIGGSGGQFLEWMLSVPPIPPVPFFRIGGRLGLGDSKHNRYMYGEGALGGIAYHEIFSTLMIPISPPDWMMILRYARPFISQSINQRASLVRPEDNGQSMTVMCTWRIQ